MRHFISFILILLIFTGCTTEDCDCDEASGATAYEEVDFDFEEIKERGKIIAITSYSSTSYFLYRGQTMGYEYELLERLADFLDVELEVKIAYNLDSMKEMLHNGQGDILAHSLTITKSRKKEMAFTVPHSSTKMVLVQRKPENWRKMKVHQIENQLIKTPLDLIGKTIHVREKSAYYDRLINLSEEVGDDIHIETVPGNLTTPEIIRKVAEGEYDYTVADQNIAEINHTYYPSLDVETPISLPTYLAWGIRKSSTNLLDTVNYWINQMKKDVDYYVIYNKYFKNKKSFKRRVESDLYSKTGGKISKYDDLIKEYSKELGWDWRLLASQIYQESKFNPNTKSWAGARGLMQVMPATAKQFGITQLFDPEQSLEAGISYLKYLNDFWSHIPDSTERLKFILASYNAGPLHVEDARKLAAKYGKDPDIWDGNVAEYLLLKSKPQYYKDEVVEYGYCRGREPYRYVQQILGRYEHYIQLIPRERQESIAMDTIIKWHLKNPINNNKRPKKSLVQQFATQGKYRS